MTNCPGTKQPVGSGAFVSSSDLQVNLHSSYPDGGSWIVSVTNASASPTPVTAYAICMAHSAYYNIQDGWLAMNSSGPYGQGWVVYENNDENAVKGLGAAAICAGT